eukprot:gene57-3452_t
MASMLVVGVVSRIASLADAVCTRVCSSTQLQPSSFAIREIEKSELSSTKVDILLIDPDILSEVVRAIPARCNWVQSTWAGVELVTTELAKVQYTPSWMLTRYAGPFGPLMSQYMLAQILSRERFVVRYAHAQMNNLWKSGSPESHTYRALSDLTLCILGVGEIGREVAKTFLSFGASVHGVVRRIPEKRDAVSGVLYYTNDDMAEAMHRSDYIINLMPSTELTRSCINVKLLQKAHVPEATFINAGRGDITAHDEDWCSYIDSGLLKQQICSLFTRILNINTISKHGFSIRVKQHAILDVFHTEPLPATSMLWQHPGITITPHVAATSFAPGVADAFVNNLERYVIDPKSVKPKVSFKDMY